jgi:hypothetical protein
MMGVRQNGFNEAADDRRRKRTARKLLSIQQVLSRLASGGT